MNGAYPVCFGTLLPDLLRLRLNKTAKGRAVSVHATSRGVGVQERDVRVDQTQWAQCTRCPHYRSCYDLSLAKLELARALGAGL
ncbi:MAG: hypothetical protein V3U29_04530 [Phycisphaeraceae bacterium]